MKVYCEAILDDITQRENLRQCISILGGVPVVNEYSVAVTFDSDAVNSEKLIELFEHYSSRTMRFIKS